MGPVIRQQFVLNTIFGILCLRYTQEEIFPYGSLFFQIYTTPGVGYLYAEEWVSFQQCFDGKVDYTYIHIHICIY